MLENVQNQLGVPLPDDVPPEWIELIPSGPHIIGADGRSWVNDAQDKIISAFNSRAHPMVIDWEHATEHRAPQGLDAPAAGWVDRLEVRGGAIWGHVKEWTARARQQLTDRAYRFLSPVFLFERGSARIVSITSAALTNTPNLTLTALNRMGQGVIALTEGERHIARTMGLSEADMLKHKQAHHSQAANAIRLNAQLSPDQRRICEEMGIDPAEFLARRTKK